MKDSYFLQLARRILFLSSHLQLRTAMSWSDLLPLRSSRVLRSNSNVLQQGLFDFELLETREQQNASALWLRPDNKRPDKEIEV